MDKGEKWDELMKCIGWIGNPSVDIVTMEIYASKQGNHEKYLKLKKIGEKLDHFFETNAPDSVLTDYAEAYALLGAIKGIVANKSFRG